MKTMARPFDAVGTAKARTEIGVEALDNGPGVLIYEVDEMDIKGMVPMIIDGRTSAEGAGR